MAADAGSETSLQEKLQGQVASSVKEALEKSTTILSNLHHLSTYLEVISKMAGSADRVKNAHEQIQTIRADCASLLQTMYLGEIGLQSLLDMLKTSSLSGLMPHIFSDPVSSATVTASGESDHGETIFDHDGVLGKHSTEHVLDDEPSSKKSGCNRKFAINSDPNQIPTHCRNCRDGTVPNEPAITTEQSSSSAPSMTTPSPVVKGGTAVANNPNKHLKPKVTRRGKFNALICKLCGISFFYRRCLLRHLRENHAQAVDVNNLHGYDQFIQVVSQDNSNSSTYKDDAEEPASLSQSSGMDITGSSQVNDDVDYDSLQNISTCDQSQLRFNDSTKLNQTDLTQPEQELNQSEPDLTQPELTEPPIDQSNLGLPSSSVSASVTSSIIEAVQNQAILEQASALLSQSNIETQSGTQPVPSTSLISHINPVADSKSSGNRSQAVSSAAGRQEEGSSGFREFKCTVCNKAFDRPYRLTRHLEIHDPNRPRIPCNYCSKTFTRKDSLESHIKTVHASVYPFTCNHDGCTRSFATRSMYLNHLKVHGDNKPYHCQECSDCFTLLTELKDHFRKEHPENESLRCTECFKVFSSLDELEEHKLRDHRFECENCGKVFARLAYLQVHVRVHNGESKFNCRFCSEGFNSAYSYRQHMKIHPEYRRVVNVFPCHPCGKSFQEPKELIAHYETPDHKEKAANVDTAVGPSTATSMMEGDLSVMGELMTDQIINSIVNTHGGFEEISSSQTLT